MTQTVMVKKQVLDDILSSLKEVNKNFKRLEKKVESLAPIYGSDAWWDKETNEALDEYKKGLGKSIKTVKKLNEHLDNLENSNGNSISAKS